MTFVRTFKFFDFLGHTRDIAGEDDSRDVARKIINVGRISQFEEDVVGSFEQQRFCVPELCSGRE